MNTIQVFWYDSTKGMNPRSTDCEADILTTTRSHRYLEFLASKPDKNGMKIFWICNSTTIYPLKAKSYFGNEDNAQQRGLLWNVLLELSLPFHRSSKNIALNNYFTDMNGTVHLLQKGLTFVGTF